jgi:hypothetical protein
MRHWRHKDHTEDTIIVDMAAISPPVPAPTEDIGTRALTDAASAIDSAARALTAATPAPPPETKHVQFYDKDGAPYRSCTIRTERRGSQVFHRLLAQATAIELDVAE